MQAIISGGELRFGAEEGDDTERALLFCSLLMDPRQIRELRTQFLGYDLEDENARPTGPGGSAGIGAEETSSPYAGISDEDALAVLSDPFLLEVARKNSAVPPNEYTVVLAGDLTPGSVPGFAARIDMSPVDGTNLDYDFS